jgi:hypothetical protein
MPTSEETGWGRPQSRVEGEADIVPWYVGFWQKNSPPERQLREWDESHLFFSEAGIMSTTRSRKRPSHRRPAPGAGKPRGLLHPRVQQVGPDHFGIVCFDPAKARSKFFLADFYGCVLIPATRVDHKDRKL